MSTLQLDRKCLGDRIVESDYSSWGHGGATTGTRTLVFTVNFLGIVFVRGLRVATSTDVLVSGNVTGGTVDAGT